MVTIINYELGNHVSIMKQLNLIGIKNELTDNHEKIAAAKKLILPGVGNFGAAMKQIKNKGLFNLLNDKVLEQKTPILGVCLGAQLMTKSSDEADVDGFGWFDATCHKFKAHGSFKVPHVGWNTVNIQSENSLIFNKASKQNYFYFTHSYFMKSNNSEEVLGKTEYGTSFCSVLNKGNIIGTQFHPEKSYDAGFHLLKNFVEKVYVS